jgi:hypothetical protein
MGIRSKGTTPKAKCISKYSELSGVAIFCLALLMSINSIGAVPLQVSAWGYNFEGECNIPTNLNSAIGIAAGGDFSIAIRSDHTVVAWGNNDIGQTNVPSRLANVIAISASNQRFAIALRADGTVYYHS